MKNLFLIFLLIINSGCATIQVKTEHGFGHPYEGLTYAVEDDTSVLIFAGILFPPTLLITLPYTAVDILSSAAVDTLILPVDLMIKNDKPRLKGGHWGP